jgi:hypothetical protein
MADRSSTPHRQAHRTPTVVVRSVVALRLRRRLGAVAIADLLGMQASTVHAVLVRCRLNRLSHLDRVTGEPIRRFEHDRPGDLLQRRRQGAWQVRDRGGWRYIGRSQGGRNRAATSTRTGAPKSKYRLPVIGTCYRYRAIRSAWSPRAWGVKAAFERVA